MKPGTVLHLIKKVITKTKESTIAYELKPGFKIAVLVLGTTEPTPEQLARIQSILAS